MKNLIKFIVVIFVVAITSCGEAYTHRKTVYNGTDQPIKVKTGCCDQEITYEIAPFTEKVVFECLYEQRHKPRTNELNWDVTLYDANGNVIDLGDPLLWDDENLEKSCAFKFSYRPF